MPFLTNIPALAGSPAFAAPAAAEILRDISAPTAPEAADGKLGCRHARHTVARGTLYRGPRQRLPHLAFLSQGLNQASTRSKHQKNWAVSVTWAVAWSFVHLILPMRTDTLKALSWGLLCLGTPQSGHHRHLGRHPEPPQDGTGLARPSPVSGKFSAWTRCLSRLVGSSQSIACW